MVNARQGNRRVDDGTSSLLVKPGHDLGGYRMTDSVRYRPRGPPIGIEYMIIADSTPGFFE
jgi:hypothetical protein